MLENKKKKQTDSNLLWLVTMTTATFQKLLQIFNKYKSLLIFYIYNKLSKLELLFILIYDCIVCNEVLLVHRSLYKISPH